MLNKCVEIYGKIGKIVTIIVYVCVYIKYNASENNCLMFIRFSILLVIMLYKTFAYIFNSNET